MLMTVSLAAFHAEAEGKALHIGDWIPYGGISVAALESGAAASQHRQT